MSLNTGLRQDIVHLVPHGQVATKSWLMKQGIGLHSLDNLVKSRQLIPLVPGLYQRPGTELDWRGVVASLQSMDLLLRPGGLTALELRGLGHYVPMGKRRSVHLRGDDKMPNWTNKILAEVEFLHRSDRQLFDALIKSPSTVSESTVAGRPTIRASNPECALLEALQDVPSKITFEHADELMAGLTTLSPRALQPLLKACKSVKVKRLFFWLAERHAHAWFKKLDVSKYDLGSGKRVLAKHGKLDSKYLITVPADLHGHR